MKKDLYLRIVLTVIAVALLGIVLKPLFLGSATDAIAKTRIITLSGGETPYEVKIVQKIPADGLRMVFPLDEKTFILQLKDSVEVYKVLPRPQGND